MGFEHNSSVLLEIFTIIEQYEQNAYVYTDRRGILHIDGLKASREMSKYERNILKRLGFETGEKFGIREITQKEVSK